jgi:nucleotide-binding universal stress UspA family protein
MPTQTDGGVLVASHYGDGADAAARLASTFAARRHIPIEALAVVEPIAPDLVAYSPNFVALEAERRRWLHETAPRDIPVVVQEGHPPDRIAARANAIGATLIAMGIGHHDVLNRLLGVEEAIAVLRRASVPVLAAQPRAVAPMRSIVIATDFSPAAHRAAQLAMAFAATDADVHLVHVLPSMDLGGSNAPVWRHVYRAGVQVQFDQLIRSLDLSPNGSISTHLERGATERVICAIAMRHHADLIALGSHGKRFVDRLMLGSVSEAVLRQAECSVLIAPFSGG